MIIKPETEFEYSQCLECGSEIAFGRSDKKFCCQDCKNTYNNKNKSLRSAYRRKVDRAISRNYEVLSLLVRLGRSRVSLVEALAMGFSPQAVTSCTHQSNCGFEFQCYDIVFRVSDTNIFNIHRMSLNLRLQTK